MNELILATSNPGKINELRAILAPIHCISQVEYGIESVDEIGLSFIENALLKARHASRHTNKPALADDSGLVVTALNGQPGIRSARFAGEHANDADNIKRLLSLLEKTPDPQRHAYFYCAIVLVKYPKNPTPLLATGQISGQINQQSEGKHGFGYDPIFYLPTYQCTMAQLSATVKNTISHRALAIAQLRYQLHSAFGV